MCDFFAFFPREPNGEVPASFEEIACSALTSGDTESSHVHKMPSCHVLLLKSGGGEPRLHFTPEEQFLLVTKGIMFDCQSDGPSLDPAMILSALRRNDVNSLLRYEGNFASCAWDERSGRGYFFNDQVSQMNLYFIQQEDGLYVSTSALRLARSLKLGLDPVAVQGLFAQGVVQCPESMFKGLRRLNVGEMLVYEGGQATVANVWHLIHQGPHLRPRSEAVLRLKDVLKDRFRRYSQAISGAGIVCDITAGYDSRLVVATCLNLDLNVALTVNGPEDAVDVQIAHKIAEAVGRKIYHFDTSTMIPEDIERDLQLRLLYRTNGELPFTEIYRHSLTRPILAEHFALHFTGTGGEMFRYYPWSQEFLGIGRRRLANVDRMLRYRYLPKSQPMTEVFCRNWYPDFKERVHERLLDICKSLPNTLTTEQIDSAYMWKKTGDSTAYRSCLHNFLPTANPIVTAGVLETAASIHWPLRLTSHLQRQIISELCPALSEVETGYGGLVGSAGIKGLRAESKQVINRAQKLFGKLDKMLLGDGYRGIFVKPKPDQYGSRDRIPKTFESLLQPGEMRSERLYNSDVLASCFRGPNSSLALPKQLVARMATVELLCRELNFEPDAQFLTCG